jgi:hypothetical protein
MCATPADNLASMGRRGFAQAVLGFLQTVRDGHPAAPIVVCSPIFATWRETLGPPSRRPAKPLCCRPFYPF